MIRLATSIANVEPSAVRAIGNAALGMEDVYKLQFGESDQPTPDFIKAALAQAVAEGYLYYSENEGLPSLRRALAAKVAELHGVDVDPMAEIAITASGVQALNVGMRCVLNPGDEAIVLSPNWPNGTAIVAMFGATPIEIPMAIDGNRFEIDFAALEAAITPKTRLLLYTSPSNPLGWVATQQDQQRLLDLCRKHEMWLMADEVYERLYYGGPVAPSILRLCTRDDAVIVVQSFSKTYRMTGWRLGWIVSRRDLVHKAGQLNEFIVSHAPTMIQRAGEVALAQGEDELSAMVERFGEQMAFCHAALSAMPGIAVPRPEGAFYLFPRVEGMTDSLQFALDMLHEEKVAIAPGVAFGNGGEGAFRICCAAQMSVLEPALERIGRFLTRRV